MHQTAKPRRKASAKKKTPAKALKSPRRGECGVAISSEFKLSIVVTDMGDGSYYGDYRLTFAKKFGLKDHRESRSVSSAALRMATAAEAVDQALNDASLKITAYMDLLEDPAVSGDRKKEALQCLDALDRIVSDASAQVLADLLNWSDMTGDVSQETSAEEKPTTKDTKSTKEDSSVVSPPSVVQNKPGSPADWVQIRLPDLFDHAANPEPTEDEIVALMKWLKDEGQQEPLAVRPLIGDGDQFEVLAGKTRLAAARRLGLESLACVVHWDLQHDDDGAFRFMATNNGMRRTETAMRKIRVVNHAIESGWSVTKAGDLYGWSETHTRSMVGLLKLPAEWIGRIESGELPPTAAVRLIPFVDAPPILADLDKVWNAGGYQRDQIADKNRIAHAIERAVDEASRPIEPRDTHNYGYQYSINYDSNHARYFELAEDDEQKLQIVKLPLGKNGKLERRALNVKEYDKRQIPLIKQRIAEGKRGGKAKGKAAGKKASELTPAEAKKEAARKRKEADEKLAKQLVEWKHRMLRLGCAEAVMALPLGDWRITLLSTCLPVVVTRYNYGCGNCPIEEWLEAATILARGEQQTKVSRDTHIGLLRSTREAIATDDDEVSGLQTIDRWLTYLLLWPRAPAGTYVPLAADLPWGHNIPSIDDDAIQWIAELLGVKLPDLWKGATAMASPKQPCQRREMLRVFLELHTRDQLHDLAAEICTHLHIGPGRVAGSSLNGIPAKKIIAEQKTKAAAVTELLKLHTEAAPLKFPVSLAPPAKATSKRKKGRK